MRKFGFLLMALILAVGAVGASDGDGDEAKWYDKIDFGGDFRLRYEGFDWDGYYDDGRRDRFRYRFRVGFEAEVRDDLVVGFQLSSGNPNNPISDNQTFDGGFSKNEVSISEAFVKWTATDRLSIIGGKFRPKNLWHVSDMQWDDDSFTEGAMEMFTWKPGGAIKEIGLNLYQFVLEESGSGSDSYMFGGQFVPVFRLNDENQIAAGVGYESISHPSRVSDLAFDGDLVVDAGYVTNLVDPATGGLVSDFRVGSLFAEWKNKSIKKWPIKVSAFYYQNFGSKDQEGVILSVDPGDDPLITANAEENDTAFFGRIQVGDYKKPGQVAVRLSRYDSKPDAIFYAFAQSDSRRASNVDGYRADIRVGMPAKGYVNFTWYQTDWKIGEDSTMDRWQLDYIFRF